MSRMICKLLTKTLHAGEIPKRLKRSLIIPIYKSGSQGVPSNLRPISITSHLVKTIERGIRVKLVNFLELFNKLDPRQHGSRAHISTLSQLLQYQDDILKALENDKNMDSVYLDFAKAYDKVDHGILLHKLKRIGISGRIGRWIMNFLTEREQEVMVKGRKSSKFLLISGVPQGSVLGPLLFLIFIGEIYEGVSAIILVYVDDSKVHQVVQNEDDVEKLQASLDQIYHWEKANNMKFNGGKFLVMRYGKDVSLKESTIYFTSELQEVIQQVDNCRDLGIVMQDDATFSLQVEKVCKKIKQKCGWILRTFYNRSNKFMRHMFNTLAQSHADYCSQLWTPAEGGELEKLEGVLRTYTSKIPSVKHLNYWQRLETLKMNSQQRRIERYKILYCWKIVENIVPNCGIGINSAEEKRTGRKCTVRKLIGPQKVKTLRDSSFQCAGPRLFNSLPKEIRNLTKIPVEDFKEHLDNYLFQVPDEPKVSGLLPSCLTSEARPTNSLVHWIPHLQRTGRAPNQCFIARPRRQQGC